MIGKVLRGERPGGLIYYLLGPGRREEHLDPHIAAGWRHPAELEPPLRPDGRRDFRRLNGLLNQPHSALGPRGLDRPVWHCGVRAAPEDRMLSDDEWGQLARDIMHRTGLAPYGQDDEAIRWVAIRHAQVKDKLREVVDDLEAGTVAVYQSVRAKGDTKTGSG